MTAGSALISSVTSEVNIARERDTLWMLSATFSIKATGLFQISGIGGEYFKMTCQETDEPFVQEMSEPLIRFFKGSKVTIWPTIVIRYKHTWNLNAE
ncbi:MAG: hypothetical protein ACRD8U_20040 [Pyrinomonadaceae bacterium]